MSTVAPTPLGLAGVLLAVQDAVIDPIEVLRPTTLTTTDLATILVGALAGGATVVLLAFVITRGRPGTPPHGGQHVERRPSRTRSDPVLSTVLLVAVAATLLELVLAVAPGGLGAAALTGRLPATLMARVLLLVALALVLRAEHVDGSQPSRSLRFVAVGLSVLAAGTVALAAPGLAGASGLLWRGVVVAGLGAIVISASWVLHRLITARATVLASASAMLLVVAVGLGVAGWPEPAPPYHAERIEADGVLLDLTLAPVQPGRNEFHLYAWDDALREVDLLEVTVSVAAAMDGGSGGAGGSSGSEPSQGTALADPARQDMELLRVSPNHHLSYLLDLPDAPAWAITIHATRASGGSLMATMLVEEER